MIAHVFGEVVEKTTDALIIDVGGLGYEVQVTASDLAAANLGKSIKLYTHDHLRENAHELFGFSQVGSKKLFETLLAVSGVGPKMALSVMGVGSADAVRAAIASGNTKLIQTANGVGKRLAERIVVDLKDKVGLAGVDLAATGLLQSDSALLNDEAAEALVALGYAPQDAAKALASVPADLPTEERIKLALKPRR